MSDFGVKSTGFVPKRYIDIEDSVFDYYKDNIDQNADTATGEPLEQISTPHINEISTVWEVLQDLSALFDIDQCYDVWLDYYVKGIGLIRLSAVSTSLVLGVRGDNGVIIPDSLIVKDDNEVQYKNTLPVVITKTAVKIITFKIPDPVIDPIANPYTITLDTVDFTFNTATTLPQAIRDDLYGQILATGDYDLKLMGTDSLEVTQKTNPTFDFDLTANIHFFTAVNMTSVESGKFTTSLGTAITIVTPVTGITEVYNYYESVLGRDRETDSQLRIRYSQSLLTGDGTVEAVVSKILNNIKGITYIAGYENVEDAFANGLPGHSMHVVVEGGDTQEIAERYYKHKPAGTQTFGLTSAVVLTSNGDPFTIFLDRTIIVYAYFRITVAKETLDPPPYPDNGNETIKTIVFDTGVRIQNVGVDLTAQKYIGDIYDQITGIKSLLIEIAIHPTPNVATPTYQVGGFLTVNKTQRCALNTDRIIVL